LKQITSVIRLIKKEKMAATPSALSTTTTRRIKILGEGSAGCVFYPAPAIDLHSVIDINGLGGSLTRDQYEDGPIVTLSPISKNWIGKLMKLNSATDELARETLLIGALSQLRLLHPCFDESFTLWTAIPSSKKQLGDLRCGVIRRAHRQFDSFKKTTQITEPQYYKILIKPHCGISIHNYKSSLNIALLNQKLRFLWRQVTCLAKVAWSHGDITCSNVLSDTIKLQLCDFGFSCPVDDLWKSLARRELSREHATTYPYWPPELIWFLSPTIEENKKEEIAKKEENHKKKSKKQKRKQYRNRKNKKRKEYCNTCGNTVSSFSSSSSNQKVSIEEKEQKHKTIVEAEACDECRGNALFEAWKAKKKRALKRHAVLIEFWESDAAVRAQIPELVKRWRTNPLNFGDEAKFKFDVWGLACVTQSWICSTQDLMSNPLALKLLEITRSFVMIDPRKRPSADQVFALLPS